jgi:hypothetical protein
LLLKTDRPLGQVEAVGESDLQNLAAHPFSVETRGHSLVRPFFHALDQCHPGRIVRDASARHVLNKVFDCRSDLSRTHSKCATAAGGSRSIAMLSLNVAAYTNTETLCLKSLDISVSVGTAISSIRIVYYANTEEKSDGGCRGFGMSMLFADVLVNLKKVSIHHRTPARNASFGQP